MQDLIRPLEEIFVAVLGMTPGATAEGSAAYTVKVRKFILNNEIVITWHSEVDTYVNIGHFYRISTSTGILYSILLAWFKWRGKLKFDPVHQKSTLRH